VKYEITVVDRDYRAWVESYTLDFVNEDEVKRYCENERWSGEDYYYKKIEEKK
jgi:hypothetical protein